MCIPDASDDDAVPLTDDCKTIMDIATDRGDLTTFVKAANATGFMPFLYNVRGINTVFAPTDDAFDKLFDQLGQLPDEKTLVTLMQYHILPGRIVKTFEVTDQDNFESAIENATIGVRVGWDAVYLTSKAPRNSKIVGADIVACKSVLQVIGGVLQPYAL